MTKEDIEKCFLQAGAERMSKYFGSEKFENGMLADCILWNKDNCYYTISETDKNDFEIMYSYDLCDDYKLYTVLLKSLSDEEIEMRVNDIMQGWTPEEEKILSKYIDLYADEKFSYTIEGVLIINRKKDEKIFRYVESTVEEYTFGINAQMDELADRYDVCMDEEKYDAAVIILYQMIELSFVELGEAHSNTIALLYELRVFAEIYLPIKERLQANMLLYKCNSKKYGNTHLSTICIILSIAALVNELQEYEDAILLAKYVQKIIEKKYGEKSDRNIDAIACLMNHYYKSGAMGRAFACAEKCLNLCEDQNAKQARSVKSFIAKMYRNDFYKDYEKALRYDMEAYWGIEDRSVISEELIDCKDGIALDYFLLERPEEAIAIETEVVELAEIFYGVDSLQYLFYLTNFSTILTDLERHEEALKISEHICVAYCKKLGKFHDDSMEAIDNVIIDLVNAKQYERAMKMAGGTYMERLKELGREHEETQIAMQQYMDLRDGNWR